MKKLFLEYCLNNKYHQNDAQIKALELLILFSKGKFSNNNWLKFFEEKKHKLAFYLHGDVGIGKTMLLNFFYDHLNIPKQRLHFNEFMINFHDFTHLHKKTNDRVIQDLYKTLTFDQTCSYINSLLNRWMVLRDNKHYPKNNT